MSDFDDRRATACNAVTGYTVPQRSKDNHRNRGCEHDSVLSTRRFEMTRAVSPKPPLAMLLTAPRPADTVTILKCVSGIACKRVIAQVGVAPQIQGYSAGALFSVFEELVADILQLSSVLQGLEGIRQALVIRGAPGAHLDLKHNHRRKKVNFQTPPFGRRWVLIDLDKIPLPTTSRLPDILAVCEYLVTLLPLEFLESSYHWQLSSSAGLGDPSKISMHLWFYFDRTVPDADLKRWGTWWNELKGSETVDTALFNDVQAHYTAAPQFQGMADPFPVRSGLVRKLRDEVVLVLPSPKMIAATRNAGKKNSPLQARAGFATHLTSIGDHPGGSGFYGPILRAIASYVATQSSETLDKEALYVKVRDRVFAADCSNHDKSYVDEMASRDHIMPAIDGAIDKFGHGAGARGKSRQIEGVPPHFRSKPVSAEKAFTTLQKAIRKVFGP